MTKINLEIKGVNKLIDKLKNFGEEGKQSAESTVRSTAELITGDAKTNASRFINTGRLAGSIANQQIGDYTYRIYSTADYAPYMEFGTGGKVSVPPELQSLASSIRQRNTKGTFEKGLDNIRQWCNNKGIDEKAAYPIFMSILRNGLQPKPFMYPALVNNRSTLHKLLKAEFERLSKKV